MEDWFEAIFEGLLPAIVVILIISGISVVMLLGLYRVTVPAKTDEQVQCESVEGAVWGQHACFKDGIKLNFAEP